MITKIGVSEFNTPANALSIPCSAIQNKYAGNRLPKTPDMNMMNILFRGICLKLLYATGNNINPEEMIRSEATWKAVKCSSPSFINIKLLPQINESAIKINQLINLLFKILFISF